jgi:serine/threonine protein kinase
MNLNRLLVMPCRLLLKSGRGAYSAAISQRPSHVRVQEMPFSGFVDSGALKGDEKRTAFREAISLRGYNVVRPLGYGAFGHVTLCTGKESGAPCAIKTARMKGAELAPDMAEEARKQKAELDQMVSQMSDGLVKSFMVKSLGKLSEHIVNASPKDGEFRLYNGRLVRRAIAESEILDRVKQCPFVINKKKHFISGKDLFLVTELIEGGSLSRYLASQKGGRISEDEAKFFVKELVVALYKLGGCGVTHRDLKPSNIMIDRDGHLKLMDFGLATLRRTNLVLICGTPEYIPPEVLTLKTWDAPALDWYALGVLLYRFLYGKTPHDDESAQNIFLNALMSNVKFPDTAEDGHPVHISEAAKNLILGLMRSNPTDRFTAPDVMQHPWLEGTDWSAVEARKLEPPHVPLGTPGAYFITKHPVLQ